MNARKPASAGQDIEPWPVGWPLPLTAICSTLRWEDVVEVYLAVCEQVWGPAAEPAVAAPQAQPPQQRAA